MMQLTRDKTGVFLLSVFQNDGTTPQSLVGCTLYFHALVYNVAIDKSSPSSGITVSNTAGGANCATLQIEPTDTAMIPASGVFVGPYEITLQNGSEAYELTVGSLQISPNVSTP